MNHKTKILFILAQLVGGGAEKVTINIMRLLDKSRFEVHLVVMSKEGPAFDLIPKEVILHDLQVSKTIFSIFKLRRKIVEIAPDILFSSLIRTHIALALSLYGLKQPPIVVMRSPNSPKLLLKNRELSPVKKFFLEYAYRQSNTILAQTPEMKEEIAHYHHIDRTKIDVFLNPIDTDRIDAQIQNISNPFYDKGSIHVVAAGRLSPQKGFDILIHAFNIVVATNPSYQLYIIGEDTGEGEKLYQLVKEMQLEEHITFLGYQKNPYQFYYYADLYVLSSRWEGLPNTVLENLYLKKPIIATTCIPFMSQLIENHHNGLLVDVEDIDQLAHAILHYHTIEPIDSKYIQKKSKLNQFFQFKRETSLKDV